MMLLVVVVATALSSGVTSVGAMTGLRAKSKSVIESFKGFLGAKSPPEKKKIPGWGDEVTRWYVAASPTENEDSEIVNVSLTRTTRKLENPPTDSLESGNQPTDSLTYREATGLSILDTSSKLYGPDFLLPLAAITNLSLKRTSRSLFMERVFGRKYDPRWQAYMKPLVMYVRYHLWDEVSKEAAKMSILDGSCSDLEGLKEHKEYIASKVAEMKLLKDKYYPFHGADRGQAGEWTWDDAMKLGSLQMQCGALKLSNALIEAGRGEDAAVAASKLAETWILSPSKELLTREIGEREATDFMALAKSGRPHHLLDLLSNYLPKGWKFTRGKMGVFKRGLFRAAALVRGPVYAINHIMG